MVRFVCFKIGDYFYKTIEPKTPEIQENLKKRIESET